METLSLSWRIPWTEAGDSSPRHGVGQWLKQLRSARNHLCGPEVARKWASAPATGDLSSIWSARKKEMATANVPDGETDELRPQMKSERNWATSFSQARSIGWSRTQAAFRLFRFLNFGRKWSGPCSDEHSDAAQSQTPTKRWLTAAAAAEVELTLLIQAMGSGWILPRSWARAGGNFRTWQSTINGLGPQYLRNQGMRETLYLHWVMAKCSRL